MADGYWRYADSRFAPAVAPPPTSALSLKRPRPDYPEVPVGQEMLGYGPRGEERAGHIPVGQEMLGYGPRGEERAGRLSVRDTETINASYDRYLRNGVSSFGPTEPVRHASGGMTGRLGDDPRLVGVGGIASGRPEPALPPDASKTIFVEGLPANCSRREVSHVFRPFVGFREVRLVNKESRHSGGDPLVLCFVDFTTPSQAAIALEALQGYKFDEHERDSANLRLQFARFPGPRSSGGPRGRR